MFKLKVKLCLTSIVLIIAFVFAALPFAGCSLFRSLKFDYNKGEVASAKVENAQYTPDIDKYIAATSVQAKSVTASRATNEDFTALIDEYAKVENYAGAGKYLGYDIYEIKDEIKFVVEKVPAFNQWFRMPTMREAQGYVHIPYYENWAYYLEMDEETSMLSITRVCWATRSRYLDFENNKTVEEYEDGSNFIQYEIMKINYLETETDEIVECFIYSVGIDKVQSGTNYYNPDPDNYHPFEFQYLRNVKDKSMIKYHITVAERYGAEESFDEGGMDIRGLTPYGVRREFTIVNYDGYSDIDVTKIDQKFATLNAPENDGSVDFDVNCNNIKILVDAIGYEEDYSNLSPTDLLDGISKHVIDNFEIKNNWSEIYKEQSTAIIVPTILGPFYGKDIWLSDVYTYVSCRSNEKNIVEFNAGANIYDTSKFNLNNEYSLSVALRSRETGRLYIIASEYNKLEKTYYNGSTTEYYYRFSQPSYYLDSSLIAVDEDGTYDITCVLTAKSGYGDEILFDTLQVAYMRGYSGLIIPDSVDSNGITHKYTATGTGGKLTIAVTSENN